MKYETNNANKKGLKSVLFKNKELNLNLMQT